MFSINKARITYLILVFAGLLFSAWGFLNHDQYIFDQNGSDSSYSKQESEPYEPNQPLDGLAIIPGQSLLYFIAFLWISFPFLKRFLFPKTNLDFSSRSPPFSDL